MPRPRLPTIRWLTRALSAPTVALWLVGALALTAASSLVPRPAYDRPGLESLRFGYPMPFITQNRSDLAPERYPVFVTWPGSPARLEAGLFAVNVAFYVTAFALGRVLLRRRNDAP